MAKGLDIGSCNQSPETCPVAAQAQVDREFYQAFGDLDPTSEVILPMLENFVTNCLKGTCLGQNPERTEEHLRAWLHPEE